MQDLLFPHTFIIYLHREAEWFSMSPRGSMELSQADSPLDHSYLGVLPGPWSAQHSAVASDCRASAPCSIMEA